MGNTQNANDYTTPNTGFTILPQDPVSVTDVLQPGNITPGFHWYGFTNVTSFGETTLGISIQITSQYGTVEISLPDADPNVIHRNIYKTQANSFTPYFLTSVKGNRAATYIDQAPDSDSTLETAPSYNTAHSINFTKGVYSTYAPRLRSYDVSDFATGFDQLTAYELSTQMNICATSVDGSGVRLPPIDTRRLGQTFMIYNTDTVNILKIYPGFGARLADSTVFLATNASLDIDPSTWYKFIAIDATTWMMYSSEQYVF